MLPAVILSVVAFVAGHPTTVSCDASLGGHAATDAQATAFTPYGGDTIYVVPAFCEAAAQPVGTDAFARAIDVFIHEAAHARGVRKEACAEFFADVGVYLVLDRFYGIRPFSPMSRLVGAQVLALSRTLPPEYQPELCWPGFG